MILLLGFAFVSGLITVLSPCILPVLPVVLTGGAGAGRGRPLGVVLGFAAAFAGFTLALTAVVQSLGISPDLLRYAAVGLIVAFGLVLLVPKLRELFERATARLAGFSLAGRRFGPRVRRGGATGVPPIAGSGFWSGILLGLGLGVVWTPCVGPIMASVASLALTRRLDGGAVAITLAYTLGTSLSMLAIMLGGRTLLSRLPGLRSAAIQRVFGVLLIAAGLAVGLGWDRRFQGVVLNLLPGYGSGLTAVEDTAGVREALALRTGGDGPRTGQAGDYGPAPPLVATGAWFNSEPLRPEDLRGKVVLVDFWTYSCVNCLRTLPYLRRWHEAYADQGFLLLGVHTPEFEFEKSAENVKKAIRQLGVSWPVVQDNDYAQWQAYANRFWPAHYLIDAKGRLRYFHFGEGAYEETEGALRMLLRETGGLVGREVSGPEPELAAGTPETYLGYGRARGFASAVPPKPDSSERYRPARTPGSGEWNLEGGWTIHREYVVPDSAGSLELGFRARDVYLVVEPEGPGGSIRVDLDGSPAPETQDVRQGLLEPGSSRLYRLVALGEAGAHVLRLEVRGRLRLYAFTFG
jgi:cytochrome c biogenesis protein CcdA/thiol-disulfide isomerase/thioredoxin